jgi:hypothetical protein
MAATGGVFPAPLRAILDESGLSETGASGNRAGTPDRDEAAAMLKDGPARDAGNSPSVTSPGCACQM